MNRARVPEPAEFKKPPAERNSRGEIRRRVERQDRRQFFRRERKFAPYLLGVQACNQHTRRGRRPDARHFSDRSSRPPDNLRIWRLRSWQEHEPAHLFCLFRREKVSALSTAFVEHS